MNETKKTASSAATFATYSTPVFLCIYLFALISLCFLFDVSVYTVYKSRILCKRGNSPLHRGERVLQWALLTRVHNGLRFSTYRANSKYSIVWYLELHGIVVLLFQWSSTLPDSEQNERQQLFYRNLRRTKRRDKTAHNTGT